MDDFDPTAYEHMVLDDDEQEDAGEGDEDAEGNPKVQKQQPFKQAILICLDVHNVNPLFPVTETDDSISWKTLLTAICQFLKSRIISNEYDKVGLTLFGTRESSNVFKLDNIYEVLPMDFLSSTAIGAAANLTQVDFETFSKKYGSLANQAATSRHHTATTSPISSLFRYSLRVN
eukprot:Protomagalhaensia_sp_Gyna_25__4730@NODE_463_length_3372_cov_36_305731_g358_i0_p2_GENE_NODE_463_length_3372_cov_36_305731_g358_i0NODE_463_length_3372_cov_36_305731_g358_i0_p2_ORF_typecomplete_len175_score30_55Ku_N/PF03731_15/1_5e08_NODE_463_length_3372_cov_36_305731_g358_i0154678